MKTASTTLRRVLTAAIVLAIAGQACTFSLFQTPAIGSGTQTPVAVSVTSTPQAMAQTTFIVTIPAPLAAGETLSLILLDEVTGLPWNYTTYQMAALDTLTYSATVPLGYDAVIKYRYMRTGTTTTLEDTTRGQLIRYRMYDVVGPGEIHDIVAGWADTSYARPTGQIVGQIFNSDTGSPLPNILVTASGEQALTDSMGRYELSGLPVGTHNLVVYSLDGLYQTFQQGALVADSQETRVEVRVKPAQLVNVTFHVALPADTLAGVPVRIAGNILQLGNTFADLQGNVSTSADRMPIMSLQPDGRYAITLSMPAGAHLQYKYTLGDGYWNAEHRNNGGWVLRELIIPAQDVELNDVVETWQSDTASSPIVFEVTVPSITPAGDIIYIQLNSFNWTEPIPMWPVGNNRWIYKLYGPFNSLGTFGYRYCRNGQCGSTDDLSTYNSAKGRAATTTLTGQDIQDTVNAWKWFENPEPGTLVGATITPRGSGFYAGFEFQPTYRPNWSYYMPQALTNTQALGSNLAVFTPSWTYTHISPLTLEPVPGSDPMWIDSAIMISQARALGLNVAVFPTPRFITSSATSLSADFWLTAPRDAQWWQTWFTRYRAFAVNYADLASQTGSQMLILGGDWIMPALPGGTMPDGTPSNVPADVEAQWKSIIAEVRAHFKGSIYWALPYTKSSLGTPLNFLQDVDGIYLLWSAPLSTNPSATKTDYANEAGRLLDNEVFALTSLLKKPLILSVAYPSAAGAANGCIADGQGGCLDLAALSRPNNDIDSVPLSLQTQADIYEAMLNAINGRTWINGFVSRGFYPPAALQDKSTSIYGKPTSDIIWYWYPRLIGTVR